MADAELGSLRRFVVDGRVSSTNRDAFDATLQRLVDVARTGDGRHRLALAGAVPALLSMSGSIFPYSSHEFSESFKSFHLFVKLLRNLCAGNPINQEALVASEGVEALAQVVEVLAPQGEPFEGLQIVLQLLGNVAGHGDAVQTRIFSRFFPSVFLSIAGIANVKVREPLCMLLYTCCRENDSRCLQLADTSIVASLLNNTGGGGAPNEWLEFLISRLAFGSSPGLPTLFRSMAAETEAFTAAQAALLDILNASLNTQAEENRSSNTNTSHLITPSSWAPFLVHVIRSSAEHCASANLSGLKLPTQSPGADVLGLSLSITRILCALDANRSTIIPSLASSGMIPLLINLLHSLGLPDNAKPQQTPDVQTPHPNFPSGDVYIGYRRDVVAVIANASYRSLVVQEVVRENGGLLVVLQQCMPDSSNPFLREWGLWAIRNLLEGNVENQTELADLEIKSTVPDARLKDAGMTVEINPETGRPRLVNVAPATDNPAVDEFM